MIAGIDLGGTQVRIVFAHDDGRIASGARTRTELLGSPSGLARWAAEQIRRHAPHQAVRGIGISSPGPINPRTGELINPPNIPGSGWHHSPLASIVSQATGCPARLENDANLAGVGEHMQGAGRDSQTMVYITWSTGVGGGLIIDGRLFNGSHGTAGEVGHMIMDPNGPICACGQRGCLEAICGGANIARRLGRPANEILQSAESGQPEDLAIVTSITTTMGDALINVANFIDPEVIVIGGGFTRSWRLLQPILTGVLKSSPFITPGRRPKVLRARLGDRSGSVGAVEWARTWA